MSTISRSRSAMSSKGPPELVVLEQLPSPLAYPLEHLAHALDPLAVAVLEAALQQALEGLVEVAVEQQVVGQLGEDVVGVELEPDLGTVPLRVAGTWPRLELRPANGPGRWHGCRPRPC